MHGVTPPEHPLAGSGWSLQKRLVAGVLVLLMMATLAIGVLSVYFLRASLVAQLDDELRIIAQRIESIAAPGRGPAQSFEGPGLPTGSLIGVVQRDGTAVAAYLDDDATVRELSQVQVRVIAARTLGEPATVRLPGGLGEFRVLATPTDREHRAHRRPLHRRRHLDDGSPTAHREAETAKAHRG